MSFVRRRLAQCVSRAAQLCFQSELPAAERSLAAAGARGAAAQQSTQGTAYRLSFGLAALGLMTTAAPEAQAAANNGAAATGTQVANKAGTQGAVVPKKPYKVVFVLGGPGSGKGTQSERLVRDFGLVHLSAGDLLRAHMKSGSPEGQMVANMIANGQIVPSHVTISLLEKAMDESGKLNILIDGFPRNEENRAAFEAQTGIVPEFVLFFDCPEGVMEQRLLGRNQGRSDDNIDTIRKRFKVFEQQSMPIIEYYEALGRVRRINADRDPDAIYADVHALFEKF